MTTKSTLPRVAGLATELMAVDSTSGSEAAAITLVESILRTDGWETVRIPVTEGRDAIFASASSDVDVTFSTHLDTVPPWMPPRFENGVLHGRGACDAKGIAAAMIAAAGRCRSLGQEVGMLFVIGEETCHDGAHAANNWIVRNLPVRRRFLINGEPTDCTLATGTKGAQRVVVRTTGRAAHSAYPAMGRSATLALVRLLSELDSISWPSDELLGETTFNIGSLSGGVADNVFAPAAEARLMFRLVGDAEKVQSLVEDWAEGRAELDWGVMVPAVRLGTFDGFATSVAAFATDVPALTNWGTPCLYGPGSVHVAHTDGEQVKIVDLERAIDDYVQLAALAVEKLAAS
ncbi:MAG: M20/M25/M40 family metallo-hydrolase [Gemmatimonadota bacterium]